MASITPIASGSVLQEELEAIICIENQLRCMRKLYNQHTATVLAKLLDGGAVERGAHHAELKEEEEGPQRVTRLVINGKPA